DEARALRTPEAVRAAAERMHAFVASGESAHFALDEARLEDVVARVVDVTREAYGGFDAVPYHARERHFLAGGVDRLSFLRGVPDGEERLRAAVDLVVVSVLLDAGAGASWSYIESAGGDGATAARYARSEGLAVASVHAFRDGLFSGDAAAPWR